MNTNIKLTIPRDVKEIIDVLNSNGYEAYMVGGCVRDELLDRKPNDYDITTSAEPLEVKKIFSKTIDTGLKHGTVTVRWNSQNYEVTTYRIDGEYFDNRHPQEVTFTKSLEEDLKRRDFTINAFAYNDDTGVVDYFNGIQDLEKHIIRAVGDPNKRFQEDALRILRAVRFSAQLNFTIEEKTRLACSEEVYRLKNISEERIRDEIVKIIMSDHPEKLIDAYKLGLTKIVFPEFDLMMETKQETPYHLYDVGTHTIVALQNSAKDLITRLALLLHDVGKPITKTIDESGKAHFFNHALEGEKIARNVLRRLKFSNKIVDTVCFLIAHHSDEFISQPKYVRRAIRKISPELFPYYLDIQKADVLGQSDMTKDLVLKDNEKIRELYEEYIKENDCFSLKDLAVDGNDLLSLNIKGKEIGYILNNMLNFVVDNPSKNTKDFLLNNIEKFK